MHRKNGHFRRYDLLFALFLSHNSIHTFKEIRYTTKSCIFSVPEADMLRNDVKLLAQKENKHPNSVWTELKREFHFYSYKNIDCQTANKIKAYIKERIKNNNK